MLRPALSIVIVLFIAGSGCRKDESIPVTNLVRESLPNGATVMHYSSFPSGQEVEAAPDLVLGEMDGEMPFVFGDIRGIDVTEDGTIYVLDYQAAEVRSYEPDGNFAGVIAPKGEGPGELSRANGMVARGDTILWIQDHGKSSILGLDLRDGNSTTLPMIVRSYGYIWNGTVDNSGRHWKPRNVENGDRSYPPEEGLNVGTSERYLVSYDPQDGSRDSLFIGSARYRSYIRGNGGGGYSYYGIPFDPSYVTRIDPNGGIWTASTDMYRIARLDQHGDTVLVIQVDMQPEPVTNKDRSEFVDRMIENQNRNLGNTAEEIAALIPESKPLIAALAVADTGDLWVLRTASTGDQSRFDVFTKDGEFLRTVSMLLAPAPHLSAVVRNDAIYTLNFDSLGVPHVVRSIPEIER